MHDIRLFVDKLHADAEACMVISQATSSEAKRKVFTALAETYQKLAGEMEKIAAAHAILDEEREKNLLGLLGENGDPAQSLAEIAKVLGGASSNG